MWPNQELEGLIRRPEARGPRHETLIAPNIWHVS